MAIDSLLSRLEQRIHSDDRKRLFARRNENSTMRPKHLVLLSVEGEKTEAHYFQWLSKALAPDYSVNIVPIPHIRDGKSDPLHVAGLLYETANLIDEGYIDEDLLKKAKLKFGQDTVFDCLHRPRSLPQEKSQEIKTFFQEAQYDIEEARDRFNLNDGDQLGMVLDRDCHSHTAQLLRECFEFCQKRGWMFYLNSPCFEFWLLLHLVTPKELQEPGFLEKAFENPRESGTNTFISKRLSERAHHTKSLSQKKFNELYRETYSTALSNLRYCAHDFEELLNRAGSNLNQFFASIEIPIPTELIETPKK